MRIFSVFSSKDDQIDKIEFVKNSFSIKAFLFKYFWCFFNKLWLAGFIILAAELAIGFLGYKKILSMHEALLCGIIISFYLGSTASNWIEFKLRRKGYRLQDSVVAQSTEDAKLKYFKELERCNLARESH